MGKKSKGQLNLEHLEENHKLMPNSNLSSIRETCLGWCNYPKTVKTRTIGKSKDYLIKEGSEGKTMHG